LTIPKGRKTFFDDDPTRDQYGIMRECERVLKRRGVNVYPCLIPSMQKLTRRGIQLATKFRKLGIPVIESYPGAAQDILAIPRKRAGLNYLADALAEFGIFDNFTEKQTSHDELDAITSSIVGLFFWTGMFEGIGDFEEELLIIPDLNAYTKRWVSPKVIGISGAIGSGKSTVANYLKDNGFISCRFSQVLEKILKEKNKEINRSNLQQLGKKIHKVPGQRWLGKKLTEKLSKGKNIVIDGLRFLEDHALMIENYGPSFVHVHIETSFEERDHRIKGKSIENISLRESQNNLVETEVLKLKNLADHIILNNEEIPQLYAQINNILKI
jgi:predicted nuclease with RNAse H fold/dephospho-CoA kinase